MQAKKIALLGILTALSAIMFLVESAFPPIIIPGAKLGLGNIFVMLSLIYLGFGSTVILVLAKCLIAGIFGGVSALLYSLPAGIISLTVGYLLIKQRKNLSIISISAAMGAIHNIVQNGVFALVQETLKVLLYAPYLALLGVISGIVTGLATFLIIKFLSPFVINKFNLNQS